MGKRETDKAGQAIYGQDRSVSLLLHADMFTVSGFAACTTTRSSHLLVPDISAVADMLHNERQPKGEILVSEACVLAGTTSADTDRDDDDELAVDTN